MRLCVIVAILFLLSPLAFSQDFTKDSLGVPAEQEKLLLRSDQKIDSLEKTFYQRSDSLKQRYKNNLGKIDSVQQRFRVRLDSVHSLEARARAALSITAVDSLQSRLTGKLDSLKFLGKKSQQLKKSIDSLNALRGRTLVELNERIQGLKNNTIGKLNEVELPGELSEKVSKVTGKIDGFQIPGADFNSPDLNLDGGNIGVGKLDDFKIPSTPTSLDMNGVKDLNLNTPDTNIGEVSGISGKVSEYGGDVQGLTKGNVGQLNELPDAAEAKATELSGLNEAMEQTQTLDKYKQMAAQIQNPDSLKQFAVQEVRQVAVNHFAGKEEELKKAMEVVSKYKLKYTSLNSLGDLKKRPPNEMKDKPWIERIVPGIAIQLQKEGDNVLVDFNPYFGYRFTGRITGGLGWNQRVAYNTDINTFNKDAKIFGPRAFAEYKLWKGFSPRAEVETMNTNVPPQPYTPNVDPLTREWVWGFFVGVKKEYKFIKSVKGTALVMMRLTDPENKSPYGDVVNVRFGFEFPMKKKLTATK